MSERISGEVAGVPVDVAYGDGVLTVRVGRFDPAGAAGRLVRAHPALTARLALSVAGQDGQPAQEPGQLFDLYPEPGGLGGDLLLCDGCCLAAAGLETGCDEDDRCVRGPGHDGRCRHAGAQACQCCGSRDRLRDVPRAGAGPGLPAAGRDDQGLWHLHLAGGAQGPFPSERAAWDYWHGHARPALARPGNAGNDAPVTVTEENARDLMTGPGNPHLIWDGAEAHVVTEDTYRALHAGSPWLLITARSDLDEIDPGARTCHPARLADLLSSFGDDLAAG